jgi:hypothetical protein
MAPTVDLLVFMCVLWMSKTVLCSSTSISRSEPVEAALFRVRAVPHGSELHELSLYLLSESSDYGNVFNVLTGM